MTLIAAIITATKSSHVYCGLFNTNKYSKIEFLVLNAHNFTESSKLIHTC
jgi:hypothetical protein